MQGWIMEFHSTRSLPLLFSCLAFMAVLRQRRCWCGTAKAGPGFVVEPNNAPRLRTGIYTADVWTIKTHQKSFKRVCLCEVPRADLAEEPL